MHRPHWRSQKNTKKNKDTRYLLLCDAFLGNSKEIKLKGWNFEEPEPIDPQHQSIHAVGRNAPRRDGTIRLCKTGVSIPAGEIVPTPTSASEEHLRLNYDELVVSNSDRIAVNYVIRFLKDDSIESDL